MKQRTNSSIAIVLMMLLSVMTFVPTAQGQSSAQRFRADLGVITPAVGQVLRVTVVSDVDFGPSRIRFGWMKYLPASCNSDGVCRHAIESQGATTPVMIEGNEAVSFDVQGTGNGVRVMVESNSRKMRVQGVVFDTSTQRVVAIWHPTAEWF